jgi:hypothetical protein
MGCKLVNVLLKGQYRETPAKGNFYFKKVRKVINLFHCQLRIYFIFCVHALKYSIVEFFLFRCIDAVPKKNLILNVDFRKYSLFINELTYCFFPGTCTFTKTFLQLVEA